MLTAIQFHRFKRAKRKASRNYAKNKTTVGLTYVLNTCTGYLYIFHTSKKPKSLIPYLYLAISTATQRIPPSPCNSPWKHNIKGYFYFCQVGTYFTKKMIEIKRVRIELEIFLARNIFCKTTNFLDFFPKTDFVEGGWIH